MSLTTAVEDEDLETAFTSLQDTVRVEGKRTTAERQAFEAFDRRVRRLARTAEQPSRGTAGGDGVGGATTSVDPFQTDQTTTSTTKTSIREAYEETVMSVAHYDTEYGDTYEESVSAEFGREIAVALARSGRLSTVTLQALLGNVGRAIDERRQLETTVEQEQTSLETAAQRLQAIEDERRQIATSGLQDKRFGTLDAYRTRIELLAEKCDWIVEHRQSTIEEHRAAYSFDGDTDGFFTYLYQSYETDHPVLYLCSDVSRGLDATHDRIIEAIIRNW